MTYPTLVAGRWKKTTIGLLAAASLSGCGDELVSPHHGGHVPHDGDPWTTVVEREFAVENLAFVRIVDFVGEIRYRTGAPGIVRVVATERARSASDVARIRLAMGPRGSGFEIVAENPENVNDASVDLEILAPPGATPLIDAGVGAIDYRGRPTGSCRLAVGVGSVTATLVGSVNVVVDLGVGIGSIVLGLPLDDVVSVGPNRIEGRIGTGADGSLQVRAGVGDISLSRP